MNPNGNERREQPQRPDQQQQGQGQQPRQDQQQGGERRREQSGGQQQQEAASGAGQQYGEGNYKATRDYERGLKEHMQDHDIEREARDAAPHSPAEEKEMEDAERKGRSRAQGGGDEDMRGAGGAAQDPGKDVK